MGEVPVEKKKVWKTRFKKNQEVFLTAFLKEEKGIFYVCKGIVQTTPGPNERQIYKVKVIAVADRAIGGPPVVRQARLLGLICTKKTKELHFRLPPFMVPPGWIDQKPKDQRYVPRKQGSRQNTGKSNKKEKRGVPNQVQARGHRDSKSEKDGSGHVEPRDSNKRT